ncbi:unnamed protein product [Prunus armeniaca]
MSVEALAMAGVDYNMCYINLEEMDGRDTDNAPQKTTTGKGKFESMGYSSPLSCRGYTRLPGSHLMKLSISTLARRFAKYI